MIRYGIATFENEKWLLNDKVGRLVDQLANHFDSVSLVLGSVGKTDKTYFPNERSIYRYSIKSPNVKIITTATADSRVSIFKKMVSAARRIIPYRTYIRSSDFVYITFPGFSSFIAQVICRIYSKPYCLYFGADWQEVAQYMARWKGLSKLLFSLYSWLSIWAEKEAVRGSNFTIVAGRKIASKFKYLITPVFKTVPMIAVTKRDFYYRNDTCKNNHIICLYVGALIPRKGIKYLIEATHNLKNKNYNIFLKLIGPAEHTYLKFLKNRIKKFGIEDNVEIIGNVSELDQLLDYYRKADLFTLASSGEGFPRVIYEAMSQGLPVVTTKIDTISACVRNKKEVLFARAQNALSISEAIEKLITDNKLRQCLIANGYIFARNEIGSNGSHGDQVLRLIKQYVT